jgi:hypothetical protein
VIFMLFGFCMFRVVYQFDVVRRGLQAPIRLSELGPGGGGAATAPGFVPFLRDALFQAFVRGQGPSLPAAERGAHSGSVLAGAFKLLAGELLSQLHARAARVESVPDAWFHAPGLQQAQLLRGAI